MSLAAVRKDGSIEKLDGRGSGGWKLLNWVKSMPCYEVSLASFRLNDIGKVPGVWGVEWRDLGR